MRRRSPVVKKDAEQVHAWLESQSHMGIPTQDIADRLGWDFRRTAVALKYLVQHKGYTRYRWRSDDGRRFESVW